MAKYVNAAICAEIISERLNIPLYDLVDIFADVPSVNAEDVHGTCSKTEQVEVVRCKDCAHRLTHECHLLFDTDDNKEYYLAMGEDFFCADGERKEQT